MINGRTITVVAATDINHNIGNAGDLPWPRIKTDMAHFRELTMGHTVIMGRKTWDSIGRKALKGRQNIIVTRDPSLLGLASSNTAFVASLDEALLAAKHDVYVIGGAEIYAQALPRADHLVLTIIHGQWPADTRFPSHCMLGEWVVTDTKWVKDPDTGIDVSVFVLKACPHEPAADYGPLPPHETANLPAPELGAV